MTAILDPASYAQGLRDAAAMLYVDRQTIRLHAGEMMPAEMRAVLAVLGWKRRELEGMAERAMAEVSASRSLDLGNQNGGAPPPSGQTLLLPAKVSASA